MQKAMEAHQTLYTPDLIRFDRGPIQLFLDPEGPNWLATDSRGAWILERMGEGETLGALVQAYAQEFKMDWAKAWLHVHDFLQGVRRASLLDTQPYQRPPYEGRGQTLALRRLKEFWVHTNNSCNLTCTHCLVSSHPKADPGLPGEVLRSVLQQARDLGAWRFYFTGGEPLLRSDFVDLARWILERPEKDGGPTTELIVLTNGMLFNASRLQDLRQLDPQRVKFQVSLDGSTPEINDPIRGKGTYARILQGIQQLVEGGFQVSLTPVVHRKNLEDLPRFVTLAQRLGVTSLHLMWPHLRGRARDQEDQFRIPPEALVSAVASVLQACRETGVRLDNYESIRGRINRRAGLRYDLSNACWESLCVYSDGGIYPSPAMAGETGLCLGRIQEVSLEAIWRESPLAQEIRRQSVVDLPGIQEDPFRFLTGGGDLDHIYFFHGSFQGRDPYEPVYRFLILEAMEELARWGARRVSPHSGSTAPVVYHAMGQDGIACGAEVNPGSVSTLHSNCVLAFDVDHPRKVVQAFYTQAAETPQPGLCCPTRYEEAEVDHIPQEVLERFYGCGSPIVQARVQPGETVVDLGSGGGIDCFIAARKVGPRGKVIGVDMTDAMLEVARRNQVLVAQRLGYDVVEFRKGFLESIPVEANTVDVITSNCVINLSPDKRAVFSEMWRILRDGGRIVISDIVAQEPVPPHIRVNEHLWGECIAGALTEDVFLAWLEQAGFYGLEILSRTFYKEVEGWRFDSITVRGFKYAKKQGCRFIGQKAIYRGPFKAVIDEEGHLFPRDAVVEICTDTATKLLAPPYQAWFEVLQPDGQREGPQGEETTPCCPPGGEGGSCC